MSSQTRVLPSPTGGGLTRGTEAILNAILANRELDIRESQITAQQRGNALSQLNTFVSFLEPGTTLADAGPVAGRLFERALEISPEGLEELVLNRQTISSALEGIGLARLSDPEFVNSIQDPATRTLLGLEPIAAVEDARELQAQLTIANIQGIMADPDLSREMVERAAGRTPLTVRIPGVDGAPDREVQFNTEAAGEIYSQFLMQREAFDLRIRLAEMAQETEPNPLIEEIRKAVQANDFDISTPAVHRVIGVYNDAVTATQEAQARGASAREAIAAGNEVLDRFRSNSSIGEGEKLALEFLGGSIAIGEEAFLASLPPQVANVVRLGRSLAGIIGLEETAEILPTLVDALDPTRFGEIERGGFMGTGGLRFQINEPGGQPSRDIRPDAAGVGSTQPTGATTVQELHQQLRSGVSQGDQLRVGRNLLQSGELTIEDLEPMMTPEVIRQLRIEFDRTGDPEPRPSANNLPPGGVDPEGVPLAVRQDVHRMNTLLRQRERIKGELARANMDRVIDRLRTKIESGVTLV